MNKYILLFCAVYALLPCTIFADTTTDSITSKQPLPLPKPDPSSLKRTIPSSIQLPVHKNEPAILKVQQQPHVPPSISVRKQPAARPDSQLKYNVIRHNEAVAPKVSTIHAIQPQPNKPVAQVQKSENLQKTNPVGKMPFVTLENTKVSVPAQELHYNQANQQTDNSSATLSNNPSLNRQKPIPSIKHVPSQLKPNVQQINQGMPGTPDRSITPRQVITAPSSIAQNAGSK